MTLLEERKNIARAMSASDEHIKLDSLVKSKMEEYPFRIGKMKAELKV